MSFIDLLKQERELFEQNLTSTNGIEDLNVLSSIRNRIEEYNLEFSEYITLAKRTCVDQGKCSNLYHSIEGVFTEMGEIVDIFKKHSRYGKPIDVVNLKEEVGDLLWYVAIPYNEELLNDFSTEFNLYDVKFDKWCEKTTRHIMNSFISNVLYNNCLSYKDVCKMCSKFFGFDEKDMSDIMKMNIKKLYLRYGEKFSSEKALNRNLKSEREILEGVKNV